MAWVRWATVLILGGAALLSASDKKDKAKPAGPQMIDSGSFGVFVRGQRAVTEAFSVQQDNGVSLIKSQLKETGSSAAFGQKSELQITSSGELVRYTWDDGSGSLVVTPNNDFLLEKITTAASTKP